MNLKLIILPTQFIVFNFIYFWYYDYTVIINSFNIIQLLQADSIIHSIGFIFRYFQLFNKNPFYKETVIYRYIYYLLVLILIGLLNIITCFSYLLVTNSLFIFLIFPEVSRKMMNLSLFQRIKFLIQNSIDTLLINTLSKYVSDIINIIAKNVLKINPKVHYLEIRPYIENETTYHKKKLFFKFANSFLLVTYLNYLEYSGYIISTKLLRRYFGVTNEMQSINSENNKVDYLTSLLNERRWNDLLKPYALYSLIKVYTENKQKSFFAKYFKVVMSKLRNAFRRFLCIYSFSKIYKYGFICPLFSTIFIRKFRNYGFNYFLSFIIIATVIIYILEIGCFFSIFFSEFIPLILFNNIGKKFINNSIHYFINIFTYENFIKICFTSRNQFNQSFITTYYHKKDVIKRYL